MKITHKMPSVRSHNTHATPSSPLSSPTSRQKPATCNNRYTIQSKLPSSPAQPVSFRHPRLLSQFLPDVSPYNIIRKKRKKNKLRFLSSRFPFPRVRSPIRSLDLVPLVLEAVKNPVRMADDEGEENTSRGNEWEVVSLTASAYAAAPGPKEVESNDNDKPNTSAEEVETSRALFMSGHFVFPPTQHEDLPLEPDNGVVDSDHGDKDVVTKLASEEAGRSSGKDEESWEFKGLAVPDEFQGIQIFDEKGNRLSFHGTDFEEGTNLQGLHLVKEQNLYSASKFSSFHSETTLGGSAPYGEETAVPDFIEPSEQGLGAGDITPRPSEDHKHDGSRLPCGAWWKRGAASLYSKAKEANAFWSIFIAAAVMGLVILGQQWQQERWQTMQLKWQFRLNSESQKTGRMFGPISRLKDVIVGGHRRCSFIRGSSSSEN